MLPEWNEHAYTRERKNQYLVGFDPVIYGYPAPENNCCAINATVVAVGETYINEFNISL